MIEMVNFLNLSSKLQNTNINLYISQNLVEKNNSPSLGESKVFDLHEK